MNEHCTATFPPLLGRHCAPVYEHVRVQAKALTVIRDPSIVTRSWQCFAYHCYKVLANLVLQIGDDGQRINES